MADKCEECPVCVPGAPMWVTTFGDLMSLLLCFFVLLLSFSSMDAAKYKQVAGSMEKAFGVQRETKTMDPPKGIKMVALDFQQPLIAVMPKDEFVAMKEIETIGEELEEKLEEELGEDFEDEKELIQIKVGENEITISLMGESTFDSGKAEIKNKTIPVIRAIGETLKNRAGDIVISGHSDNVPVRGGPFKSNLKLSIARAATVAEFLLNDQKITPARIATMGFGEYRPLASNETPGGRQKNRRVDIILKLGEPDPRKSSTNKKTQVNPSPEGNNPEVIPEGDNPSLNIYQETEIVEETGSAMIESEEEQETALIE
jgi:chemotaxis protein MotB